ncbi:hypothetical protein [Leucobacter komagatae]|uniref:Uncharacterized protein n=1 Tax=Leucobacter komagatae TaxID=55969 RepID=A0A0D0IS40_9MICO|nr:hypothetical protein [Leucobacter komagatae]KIP53802.1 hypothetical protein SD72_01040 [Leucobacter komagatae]
MSASEIADEKWQRFCLDCDPPQLCTRELLFFPDLGAYRVRVCPEHGACAMETVLAKGDAPRPGASGSSMGALP